MYSKDLESVRFCKPCMWPQKGPADLYDQKLALKWQAQRSKCSPAVEEDDAIGAGKIQAQGSRLDAAEEDTNLHRQLKSSELV